MLASLASARLLRCSTHLPPAAGAAHRPQVTAAAAAVPTMAAEKRVARGIVFEYGLRALLLRCRPPPPPAPVLAAPTLIASHNPTHTAWQHGRHAHQGRHRLCRHAAAGGAGRRRRADRGCTRPLPAGLWLPACCCHDRGDPTRLAAKLTAAAACKQSLNHQPAATHASQATSWTSSRRCRRSSRRRHTQRLRPSRRRPCRTCRWAVRVVAGSSEKMQVVLRKFSLVVRCAQSARRHRQPALSPLHPRS